MMVFLDRDTEDLIMKTTILIDRSEHNLALLSEMGKMSYDIETNLVQHFKESGLNVSVIFVSSHVSFETEDNAARLIQLMNQMGFN
jgi:hypothetical protein